MKHSSISIHSAISTTLAIIALVVSGCAKEKENSPLKPEYPQEAFDFSTRSTYTLDLSYDVPKNYEIYFEVYTENPMTIDLNGQLVKRTDVTPIDKGFTDGTGVYRNPIIVSTAAENLYIYTPSLGVPQLLSCNIENGTLSASSPYKWTEGAAGATASQTRAISSDNQTQFDIQTLTLGTWRHSEGEEVQLGGYLPNLYGSSAHIWGRPDYMHAANERIFPNEGIKPAIEISANIFKTIRTVLPGDNNGSINPEVLKNGAIHVTKEAEVDLYFVAQGGMYQNVLAYYCYPTGQAPTDPSQINAQVIAIPNAIDIKFQAPVNNQFYYGAILPGEGVRLHYIDPNGIDKGETFPAGTSIGWILYSDGYKFSRNSSYQVIGLPTVGNGAIYSDAKLMQNEIPHMAVFRHGDFVITAFEDCIQTSNSHCDYDDVIFHVESTPADAITPGIPDKDPDQPQQTEVTYRGILSFEDNWPYRGDFDMNDVVVNYESTVTYNIKNEVTKTVDEYTVVWSGAQYNNSFAIENKNLSGNATVTLEGGDGKAEVDGNIIRVTGPVLEYANQPEKKTLTVTTKYTTPIAKSTFVFPPYNPFINVNGNKAREVHLTNMKPTIFNDANWLGYGHDKSNPEKNLYYITFDDNGIQMPFAMDILFNSQAEMNTYVIPKETESINLYYPGFIKWVQSNGATDKDWYLHPIKK